MRDTMLLTHEKQLSQLSIIIFNDENAGTDDRHKRSVTSNSISLQTDVYNMSTVRLGRQESERRNYYSGL